ncbi:hypothetical protein CHS0354_021739 [Potamilus streckersoni]|uniref:Copine C-terminal domain-containing protein n=1 Tax=Potamilus streckersoni TaxID=2493646 RepID=A0AAE0TLE9_9BIVA|nr:hypothetical protein CHS0354_021739 [Potamilus streckersoni]
MTLLSQLRLYSSPLNQNVNITKEKWKCWKVTNRLSSEGKFAERDIVQVVQLRNFLTGTKLENAEDSLAKKALLVVPTHFLSNMQIHEVKPKPPRSDPKHPLKRPLHPLDFSQLLGEAPLQHQQNRGESSQEQATGGIPSQPHGPKQDCADAPQFQDYKGASHMKLHRKHAI